tara:strand:+ start:81 stop:464 length:384 start_codon:yes stop_codon:yes gene_type:complete
MSLTMSSKVTDNNLDNKIKTGIIDSTEKFVKFINVLSLDENTDFYNKLPSDVQIRLRTLEEMWKNNDSVEVNHYFDMKEHHTHITGYMINNDNLKNLWWDYIKSGMDLRCKMLELVDLGTNLSQSLY